MVSTVLSVVVSLLSARTSVDLKLQIALSILQGLPSNPSESYVEKIHSFGVNRHPCKFVEFETHGAINSA